MKRMFNKCYFAPILGILNNQFKPTSVQKFSRISKAHSALAHPILLYESEIGPLGKKRGIEDDWHQSRWNFRRTFGYALFDHKRYKEILEQLKVEPADEKVRRYKSYWLLHVTGMNSNRKPRIMLNYRPWKKMTWETFEEMFRRGQNRSIET